MCRCVVVCHNVSCNEGAFGETIGRIPCTLHSVYVGRYVGVPKEIVCT